MGGHREGVEAPDGGQPVARLAEGRDDQTYRLMTNEDDPAANTYEDLARLVRVVDGAALDGGEARFDSAAFPPDGWIAPA